MMKNNIFNIFWLFCMSFSFSVQGAPIPGDQLYRSPNVYSYQLNPKGNLLVGYRVKEKETVLELLDPSLETAQEIIGFDWANYAYLKEYYWIDDNTLFIRYQQNKNKENKAFIHLSFNSKNKVIPKLKIIKARGEILSALPEEENKVIFQHRTGSAVDDINVYFATTENLIKNDFYRKDKFKNKLDKAFVYFPDGDNQIRLAATIEKEDLVFWYLEENKNKWLPFYKYNSLDYDFEPVGFLGEGKLAVITNKENDLKALFEFDIKTKEIGKLLFQHPKYDLTTASINNRTKKVKYVQYFDHGQLTTEYFSEKNSKKDFLLKKAFPNKQIFVISGNDSVENNVVRVFSSNDPGSFFLYNHKTQKATLIAKRFEDMDQYQMDQSENFSVKNKEGKEIEAILTRPKNYNNKVLLVMPHGGPIGVRDYDYFNPEVQYFVSRGFTVLRVNFSGSTGYGKKFLKSGKGQFGKKIEQDISAAVTHVRKKYKFNQMCSIGASYGGYSAIMLSIYNPDNYNCIIAEYGIYDLALLFNESNLQRRGSNLDSVIATVGKYDDSLKDYSPFFLAEKISVPILLIAGKTDKTAPFEHTNRMKYRLKQNKTDLETMFYEGVGHGHTKWRGNRHELAVVNDFLQRKLKLPMIKGESYKEILRNEYMLFSDSFNFKDFVKNDFAKAFKYNQKAATLGHSRGMFNVGSYYHQGKIVDKSVEEALKWYEKSSVAGYASASFRLGNLYRLGENVEKNVQKAQQYYIKALEQGEQKANLEVGANSCFKARNQFDIANCFASFEEALKDDDNKTRVWQVLTDFVWENKRTTKENQLFADFLKQNYNINLISNYTIDVDDYGILTRTYRTRQKVQVDDSVVNIDLKKNIKFGVEYELETSDSIEKPKTLLKVKWSHPEIVNPDTNQHKKQTLALERVSLHGKSWDKTNFSWYQFDQDWEMAAGEWKIELLTLDDTLLYTKTFTVK